MTSIKLVQELKIEWNEQWVNGEPKKMDRYKKFRGEHVFLFVGLVEEFKMPTSEEGDSWGNSGSDIKRNCLFRAKDIIPVIEN